MAEGNEVMREPFVFESKNKALVERTKNRLNEICDDRTFDIDFDEKSGFWYVFEVEDEDEI